MIKLIAWTAVTAIVVAASAGASERRIQKKDLPAAVAAAVDRATAGDSIKSYSREVEKGATYYEVETLRNGRARDVLLDAAGAIVEIEETVDVATAPEPVRSALGTVGGTLLTLESVTRGASVTYEAHVRKNGAQREIKLGADGKPVK